MLLSIITLYVLFLPFGSHVLNILEQYLLRLFPRSIGMNGINSSVCRYEWCKFPVFLLNINMNPNHFNRNAFSILIKS